jgi:hypothetical protein
LSTPAQAGDPVAAGFDLGKKSGAELNTCTCSPIDRNKLLSAARITASSSMTWTIGASRTRLRLNHVIVQIAPLAAASITLAKIHSRTTARYQSDVSRIFLHGADLAPYRHVGSRFETDY